jgi:K+-sensing histidine kinase KdpD
MTLPPRVSASEGWSRDELLGILLHDGRNALSALLMAVDLLRRNPLLGPVQRPLDVIKRVGDRFRIVLYCIGEAAFPEVDPSKRERAAEPLASMMEQAWRLVASLAATRSIELRIDAPANLEPLVIDRVAFVETMAALLAVAIDTSPQQAAIHVGFHPTGADISITIEWTCADATLELPKAFDRDFWLRRKGQLAMGVGLAVARAFFEARGGSLRADAIAADGGSRLRATLPFA